MKKIILMSILFLSWGAQAAYAAVISPLTMTLSSGGASVTVVTDQNAYTPGGDMSGSPGSILFMGTVGSFNISVASGVSYPSPGGGGPNLAVLNLSTFNVSSLTGGTLTVTFADTGYGTAASGFTVLPNTMVSASATATGQISNAAAGSSVSVQSWIDSANSGGAAGTQVLANSSSGPTFGFTNPTLTPYVYNGGPFSMFTKAVINLTGPVVAGAAISANLASDVRVAAVPGTVPVPEPGSLMLLSSGLFLGAVVIRGRQKKRDRAI